MTSSTHKLDDRLQHNPLSEGESRERGRRVAFESPLGIVFEVDAEKKKVRVLNVWRFDK
jgi:hypothetical protein